MARLRLSILMVLSFFFGIPDTHGQRYGPTRTIQGIATVPCNERLVTQSISPCNQLYDPTNPTIIYTKAQPTIAAAPPAEDYSTIIQLAKSLKSKKCQKCGKNGCTCGTVRGGEIINKLVDALIYALVNKVDNPATSTPVPSSGGSVPAVGSVVSTVGDTAGGMSSSAASVPTSVGTMTGGSTSSLPTDAVPKILPTSTPTDTVSNSVPTEAVSNLSDHPINSLLAALLQ